MHWYIADNQYIHALRQIDSKVQSVYTGTTTKPYIGILFSVQGYNYYVPVSSPKPKHDTMSEALDFFKFYDRRGRLICVLNLNNMIPIPDWCVERLSYDHLDRYIAFPSDKERSAYLNLLLNELHEINKKQARICASAAELRLRCQMFPESRLAKRSCCFEKLEAFAASLSKSNT